MIQAMTWALVPDVGRRDVAVGADDALELGREAAGERPRAPSALSCARVDGHAALGAAERHVDQGALPGHPHRQRANLVEVGRRVEAQAALGRTAGDVVLDAVAR